MHAERLARVMGRKINTWKVRMQRHVQERVLVVVNLMNCLLAECSEG
jgi:hypothetical protein